MVITPNTAANIIKCPCHVCLRALSDTPTFQFSEPESSSYRRKITVVVQMHHYKIGGHPVREMLLCAMHSFKKVHACIAWHTTLILGKELGNDDLHTCYFTNPLPPPMIADSNVRCETNVRSIRKLLTTLHLPWLYSAICIFVTTKFVRVFHFCIEPIIRH